MGSIVYRKSSHLRFDEENANVGSAAVCSRSVG